VVLGNPRDVAAIIDQTVFEQCRFLTLLSQRGYVYSLLAGTVNQISKKQEKLIRNLIPDDPIVAAVPSYNGDILAVSQRGRWIRFPEKTIAGVGSPVMELPKGDSLVGIVSLPTDTNVIFISTDGKLFSRSSDTLATRRGPGGNANVLFKNMSLLGVTTAREIVILTRLGKLLTIPTTDLPYRAQTETGSPIPGLSDDDSVLTFTTRA
jgi:DNA gyrase/topoisomerase IV subunit A